VVVGSGMIGLVTIQAARNAGCSRVIVVDPDEGRLKLARAAGATDAINPKATEAVGAILAMTDGRGADVAWECVGATEPIRTAIAAVRKGGAVTLVGNVSPGIELPLQSVVSRQIRVQGSWFDRLYRHEANLMKVILRP